jgi:hypothetical protein
VQQLGFRSVGDVLVARVWLDLGYGVSAACQR